MLYSWNLFRTSRIRDTQRKPETVQQLNRFTENQTPNTIITSNHATTILTYFVQPLIITCASQQHTDIDASRFNSHVFTLVNNFFKTTCALNGCWRVKEADRPRSALSYTTPHKGLNQPIRGHHTTIDTHFFQKLLLVPLTDTLKVMFLHGAIITMRRLLIHMCSTITVYDYTRKYGYVIEMTTQVIR